MGSATAAEAAAGATIWWLAPGRSPRAAAGAAGSTAATAAKNGDQPDVPPPPILPRNAAVVANASNVAADASARAASVQDAARKSGGAGRP